MESPHPESWAEAASAATFAWFVPRSPELRDLRAGGFGFGPDGPSHLETLGLVGDVEVSVETSSHEVPPDGFLRRSLLHGLLFRHLFEELEEISLPFSIEVVADDRTLIVDGGTIVFEGVRITGSNRWAGSAELGGVTLRVTLSGAVTDLELISSDDVDLPE